MGSCSGRSRVCLSEEVVIKPNSEEWVEVHQVDRERERERAHSHKVMRAGTTGSCSLSCYLPDDQKEFVE